MTIHEIEVDPTIKAHWELFARMCMPKTAPPEQHAAMEASFYGGAISVMKLMLNLTEQSDDEAHAILHGLEREAMEYTARSVECIAADLKRRADEIRSDQAKGGKHVH